MRKYTFVRKGDTAENLAGRKPAIIAANPQMGAWLLERISDGRLFLYVNVHTSKSDAQMWAHATLNQQEKESTNE